MPDTSAAHVKETAALLDFVRVLERVELKSREFMMRSALTCEADKVMGTTLQSVATNSDGLDSSVPEWRATYIHTIYKH